MLGFSVILIETRHDKSYLEIGKGNNEHETW